MNRTRMIRWLGGAVSALTALQPGGAWACAACFGQSDAPMAHGMNWGIMSLLAMIVLVLVGVAGFFVVLARRAVAFEAGQLQGQPAAATERV